MPYLDLEIMGAPVIQTLRKEGGGGGGHQNHFFGPGLRAPVWSKNKGGGGAGSRAPPLDPPLDFVAVTYDLCVCFRLNLN